MPKIERIAADIRKHDEAISRVRKELRNAQARERYAKRKAEQEKIEAEKNMLYDFAQKSTVWYRGGGKWCKLSMIEYAKLRIKYNHKSDIFCRYVDFSKRS